MEKEFIQKCDCGGFHYIEVTKWDDETDYWVTLLKADGNDPFFMRLKNAFWHVFGKDITYHDFVLNKCAKEDLVDFLSK